MREACLTLQDEHGQNVPFLLWRAWAAAEGSGVEAEALEAAAALARTWSGAVVSPLRAVRRRLAGDFALIEPEGRGRLRAAIAEQEILAERLLIEALALAIPLKPGEVGKGLAALRAAAFAFGTAAPEALLAKLAGGC